MKKRISRMAARRTLLFTMMVLILSVVPAVSAMGQSGIDMIGADVIYAADNATVYTNGGVIAEPGWSKASGIEGVYTGSGTLPNPVLPGTLFQGWHKDPSLSDAKIPAGEPVESGQKYYGEWVYNGMIQRFDTVQFQYSNVGEGVTGIKNGDFLSAFGGNLGMFTFWKQGAIGTDYSGTVIADLPYKREDQGNDIFVPMTGNVYISRTVVQEGTAARVTYYLQNRGAAVSGLNLGLAGDCTIGKNDFVPLRYIQNDNGYSYLQLLDSAAGNEFRAYVAGAGITAPDRLWRGGLQSYDNANGNVFTGNVFNNGQDPKYRDGVDPAFALSWNNISLKEGETKSYSILVGAGPAGSFRAGCKLTYKVSDKIIDGGSYGNGSIVTVKTGADVPASGTYVFGGWYDGENARLYQPGDSLVMTGNKTLTPKYIKKPFTVQVAMTNNANPAVNEAVTLWENGEKKFDLPETEEGVSGIYKNDKVTSGIYDIYRGGEKTGQVINVKTENLAVNLDYATASVSLTLDGQSWDSQLAELYQSGKKICTLPETSEAGVKRYEQEYLKAGSYDIYVNGKAAGVIQAGTPAPVDFFTAKVKPNKDESFWSNGKVWLKAPGEGTSKYEAMLLAGSYSAVLPKGTYELWMNGVSTGLTVSDTNKEITPNFYTVTFYDGSVAYGSDTQWKPQMVVSGQTADAVESPKRGDAQFNGWIKDGSPFEPGNTAITAKTDLYASWNIPVVTPNAAVRKTAATYKFDNLVITGYEPAYLVKSAKITVDSGTMSVTDSENAILGNGTNSFTVVFKTGKTITDAQAYLRDVLFTIGSDPTQKVHVVVFADNN